MKSRRSERSVCLISRRREGKLIWCLPKGHVEKGETFEEAARREVREETGVWADAKTALAPIRYWFVDHESKKYILKTVHFFLMKYIRGRTADHDDEVVSARWFRLSQAMKCLAYPSERKVVQQAVKAADSD